MKKSKTKSKNSKTQVTQKGREGAKPREASKAQATSSTALVSTDIRKAYKNRLISAYFNRQH